MQCKTCALLNYKNYSVKSLSKKRDNIKREEIVGSNQCG